MQDLWRLSARALAGLIAGRKVSSAEVIDAHLARIEAVNPHLNAIVRLLADESRAAAKAADRKLAAGEPLGPLHGVPITVKENIDIAGLPTTWGLLPLKDAVVPADAPVVERMKAAGAIPIGRTNLPDMGLRVHTHSTLHGLTRNPWHAGRTAGGSSGGEGSALASGMSPLGLGNDIGGSLRNPATCNGIVSLKPTVGRIPDAGYVPSEDRPLAAQLMLVQGPMARTVADVRLGLEILNGAHPRDPISLTVPISLPAPPRPIRVALLAEPPGGTTHPSVAAATRRAADLLANAGYDVRETLPPRYEEAVDVWSRLIMGDFAALMPQLRAVMGPDAMQFLDNANAGVPPVADLAAFSFLLIQRDGVAREWSQFLAETPLILTPTWTELPFEHGYDLGGPEAAAAVGRQMRPVVHANLLGLPSAAVPAGLDPETGLPIGVLLTGARFRDDLCLDAAEAIEASLRLPTPIDPRT